MPGSGTDTLSFSLLFQRVVRNQNKSLKYLIAISDILSEAYRVNSTDPITPKLFLLPHLKCVLHHLEAEYFKRRNQIEKKEIEEKIQTLNYCIGDTFYSKQSYDEARIFYKRSENLTVQEHLPKKNLGAFYESQGNFKEAIKHYSAELEMLDSSDPDNLSEIASILSNIGDVYEKTRFYQTSIQFQESSLKILNQAHSPDSFQINQVMTKLGNLYYLKSEYLTAIQYLEKVTQVPPTKEEMLSHASALNTLGLICYYHNNTEKALYLLKKSLLIRQKSLSQDHNIDQVDFNTVFDHPAIADSLHSLGLVYFSKKQYTKAHLFFKKALNQRKILLGDENPDTIQTQKYINLTLDEL